MRQRFGQNFLADEAAARRIVEALEPVPAERVLEIGPGRGALTSHLVAAGVELTAVELDAELLKELSARWPRVTWAQGDFLRWPPPSEGTWKVVSNLPYSAGAAILQKLLDWPRWTRAVVMLQKEVADRIASPPDCADYGILTLAVQGKARVERLFDVPPGAFRPKPEVTSSVLRLYRLPESRIPHEKRFFQVVQAAFQQRRKMLWNALSIGLKLEKPDVEARLRAAGVDPTRRAQTLTLEEYNAVTERFLEERQAAI
jgi:16S rRNA (adenine1518-N6/adenine1519-N6)-dimethyltransferase